MTRPIFQVGCFMASAERPSGRAARARLGRAAIAVERGETLTDACNRPDCAADVRLEPGAVREFAFGVEVLA